MLMFHQSNHKYVTQDAFVSLKSSFSMCSFQSTVLFSTLQ